MVLENTVKLRAWLALFVLAEEGQNHEEEAKITSIAGILVISVWEAKPDRTIVESVRGRDCRIRDIGEEEAWNNYRPTLSVPLSKGAGLHTHYIEKPKPYPKHDQN